MLLVSVSHPPCIDISTAHASKKNAHNTSRHCSCSSSSSSRPSLQPTHLLSTKTPRISKVDTFYLLSMVILHSRAIPSNQKVTLPHNSKAIPHNSSRACITNHSRARRHRDILRITMVLVEAEVLNRGYWPRWRLVWHVAAAPTSASSRLAMAEYTICSMGAMLRGSNDGTEIRTRFLSIGRGNRSAAEPGIAGLTLST